MNRKGEGDQVIGVNTVEIIILALLILGAIYAIYHYMYATKSQEIVAVENTLDSIEGKVNALKNGQSTSFLVSGSEGWALFAWSKEEPGRPERCLFSSCICLCKIEATYPIVFGPQGIINSAGKGFEIIFQKEKSFFAKANGDSGGQCQNGQTGFCRKVDIQVVDVCMVTNRVKAMSDPKIAEESREAYKKQFGTVVGTVLNAGATVTQWAQMPNSGQIDKGIKCSDSKNWVANGYISNTEDMSKFDAIAMVPFRSGFIELKASKDANGIVRIVNRDYFEDDQK